MLFICLYLKGNVNATYLPIDENNKDMNEAKSVTGVKRTKTRII